MILFSLLLNIFERFHTSQENKAKNLFDVLTWKSLVTFTRVVKKQKPDEREEGFVRRGCGGCDG